MFTALALIGMTTANATDYTDFGTWSAAAGSYTTIGFGEVPLGTVLTTQYSGLTFSGDATADGTGFTTDGFMLPGGADITVDLASPQTAVGVDYPGALEITLYNSAGSLIYTSMQFGGSGSGFFGGVTTSTPFSRIVLRDWFNGYTAVFIDNLYIGGSSGPSIALGGSCPSAVTVAATGFTPGGNVAIVKSNGTGSFAVPSGSCAGTVLGVSSSGVGLVTMATANGSGAINFSGSVGSALCSKYFQFVDMSTCTPSNVDQF